MELRPIQFEQYQWLDEAEIFNKRDERVPVDWIKENANVIALLFTAKGIDRDCVIERFCEMYENVKYINLPIEVIYVPMDDSEDEMVDSYNQQANWFTLKFNDTMVHVLKFMYGVSCIPYILVMRPNCDVVSHQGVLDLERYGKNALITWLSDTDSNTTVRKFSKDAPMYGPNWKYLDHGLKKESKADYHRRFSVA